MSAYIIRQEDDRLIGYILYMMYEMYDVYDV